MARRLIDLTGRAFGRWRVVCRDAARGPGTYWWCVCDPDLGGCGRGVSVRGQDLRTGASLGCRACTAEAARNALAAAMRAEGKTLREIAAVLGVSRQRVHQILSGK